MYKRLLIGTIIVLGIAAVVFRPMLIGFVLIGVWIYLVWMIRKKKTNIFHDQMEQKLAERRLKRLKKFMLVAGISLAVGIVGVIVHNVLYGLYEKEELVSFFITLVALWVFNIATIGSLYIFLKGRRQTT